MGFCEKFKVDRVICDEIFYVTDLEENVEIGEIEVPSNSDISGNVNVTVLNCEPFIGVDQIQANLELMVQKELTISGTNLAMDIPLEFAERLPFTVTFRKCDPDNLEDIDSDLLEDIVCQVVRVDGFDDITLTPSSGNIGQDDFVSATFTEELTIMIKLKLTQERQLNLALCPPKNQFEVDV